jgi:hypothetical protein
VEPNALIAVVAIGNPPKNHASKKPVAVVQTKKVGKLNLVLPESFIFLVLSLWFNISQI